MDTTGFLSHLKSVPSYSGQIAHIEHIPPRQALYSDLETPLHPPLLAALQANHLFPLYSHQAQAVNAVLHHKHVIVVTPAASGKTLCYNVPVLHTLLTEKGSRALYLFPTKALAQDQLRGLKQLAPSEHTRLNFATFDGDTPQEERASIRKSAHIVLTNPDMLHLGIMPNHANWSSLFMRLKYIVIDEIHTYRGVFGSHVAHVMRRLRRLCNYYGSNPQFICCSATVANPKEHVERLVGLPFEVIDKDGSPHGGREFVLWNPPIIDAAKGIRRSANSEATALLIALLQRGIRSLAFARTRRLAELICLYVRDQLRDPALAQKVKPYRAGYLPEDRRKIESELFEGKLLAAVATTALELGVDIGALDATILTGYPGSIASVWQQAGRSGRRRERALSFLIGLDNPLDQYLMRHPEYVFGTSHENAITDPGNLHILKPHLLSAAWERPLVEGEAKLFGDAFATAISDLEADGLLRKQGKRWYLSASVEYPAQKINIRSTSSEEYALVEVTTGRLLETIEDASALFQVYPGAIYLHQGESYLITELDLAGRTAYARPTEATYYTVTKELTGIKILKTLREKTAGQTTVYFGEVQVTTEVLAFKRKRILTDEILGEEPLELPPYTFSTTALWFDIPPGTEDRITSSGLDYLGALHASEHAEIALLPLFALCDRNDIGGVSTPVHPDTGRAQIFIHDGHPGGIGISEKGYELIEGLWEATIKAVSECPCDDGCPGCIHSPKCGNNNEPLDKKGSLIILGRVLGRPPGVPPPISP